MSDYEHILLYQALAVGWLALAKHDEGVSALVDWFFSALFTVVMIAWMVKAWT